MTGAVRMHADQVDVAAPTVAALVAAQFPALAGQPVTALASYGTVNALFRIGDEAVARFPLRPAAVSTDDLAREQEYAALLADHLDLDVPRPLGLGRPGPGFDAPWTLSSWVPGETAEPHRVTDPTAFAHDVARLAVSMRTFAPAPGTRLPPPARPLAEGDETVRLVLERSPEHFDVDAVQSVWTASLAAPGQDDRAWVHGDLMPGNLLLRDGRLAGVIDLGSVGPADPAVDVRAAWNTLDAVGRERFLDVLEVDEATWHRSRGWALLQAVAALPYYADTNRAMTAMARQTLAALTAES